MTESFNLAHDGKSPDHYAKGTPSGFINPPLDARSAMTNDEIVIAEGKQLAEG